MQNTNDRNDKKVKKIKVAIRLLWEINKENLFQEQIPLLGVFLASSSTEKLCENMKNTTIQLYQMK